MRGPTVLSASTGSSGGARPKLLVLELWGVGDLALATPFLRAAPERFEVHLVAKPHAVELQRRLWPEVRVQPCELPWTAFRGKYRLWSWPWGLLGRLVRGWRRQGYAVAVSPRRDPRDHLLMALSGARRRAGLPTRWSGPWLTDRLGLREGSAHRYECWRAVGAALGLPLPQVNELPRRPRLPRTLVVHSGAAQIVRVWPVERFARLAQHCRGLGWSVRVACDPAQAELWRRCGEAEVVVPQGVADLLGLFDGAGAFLGNDSGPGHVAAVLGVPTFTLFGPQLPELFVPIHPDRGWLEGKPCPFKPCWDNCRFPSPHCLLGVTYEEARGAMDAFLGQLDRQRGLV